MTTDGQKRVQNRTDILIELAAISPVLADISHQDVYQAPPGYFDTLGQLILSRVHENQNINENSSPEIPFFLEQEKANAPFSAPTGFFESFPEQMMARIKSTKSGSFSEELATIAPFLAQISREMPFSVPTGYFSKFAENIKPGVEVSESEAELPAVLFGLKDKNVYQAPAGYFESFADVVLAGVKKHQPAKIVPFTKKINWLKYAAAAVLIGVVATGSLLFFNRHSTTTGDNVPSLAMVSDQEMINYLDVQPMPLITPDAGSVASADINDSDGVDLLGDIPDDELQQYVDDHSNSNGTILN